MNAARAAASFPYPGVAAHAPAVPFASLVLVGVGQVGRALLARLAAQAPPGGDEAFDRAHVHAGIQPARFRLIAVANSRRQWLDADGIDPACAIGLLEGGPCPRLDEIDGLLAGGSRQPCIVIDATASDGIATRHADWLARGIHVVTANKLGTGGPLPRWRAIRRAAQAGHSFYGDSATVGAGLPFLSTIRTLRAGGDRIRSLQGVLSGTLAWLFERYDGTRPFSALVREAQALGCTEPDPWQDLSGADVMRKLLALVRAAGIALPAAAIAHEPLVAAGHDGDWAALDAAIELRFRQARQTGRVLRYLASWEEDGPVAIGLQALDPSHPLAARGAVNRLAIRSCRYAGQSLLIEGPGAGPGVTAAALSDDLMRACRYSRTAAMP